MSEKDFWLIMTIVSSVALGAAIVLLALQTIALFGGQK